MSVEIRAALLQQAFPIDARQLGDTVLIGRGLEPPEVANEVARPQVYALQNMLPTQRGWCSVHYATALDGYTYPVYLEQVVQLRDGIGRTALCGVSGDSLYVYSSGTQVWTRVSLGTPLQRGPLTTATLRGQTYLCVARVGLYKYNFDTETMEVQTVVGIADFADILGTSAAGNHLLLISADLFFWSDPVDPLEFTPAAGSAGSTGIAANRSSLTAIIPLGDAVVAYTTLNAVYCAYTGNVNAPFAFREIADSAGVAGPEHVSGDVASGEHIAWTYSGMQRVSAQRAEQAWPELSDSIAAGLITYIGDATYPVTLQYDRLDVKISTVGTRYVLFSVRGAEATASQYPVAYVFDRALERFGRLDAPHCDVIEYRVAEYSRYLTIDSLVLPIDSYTGAIDELREEVTAQEPAFGSMFALVGRTGEVYIALPASLRNVAQYVTDEFATPCMVLGKYKLTRGATVRMESLQLQSQYSDATLAILCNDASGEYTRSVVPTASLREPGRYTVRATGHGVSVKISGVLNVSALSFELSVAGNALAPVAAASTTVESTDYMTIFGVPVTIGGEYVVSPS